MKKYFAVCLMLCLLLTGCGYDPYDPSILGYYEGTTILAEGYEIYMSEVYAGENYLLLEKDGKGILCLAGLPSDIQWGFRGETFYLKIAGEKSKGYMEKDTIKLNYLDMDMELRFTWNPDFVPGNASDEVLSEEARFWKGDWYGWWIVDRGTGSFADATGNWWDLCASVTMGSSTGGKITLWDQDSSKADPLGEVAFYLNDEGIAVSQDGYFGAAVITEGDWYIDPDESGMENMLVISGGAENDTGTFYYTAYLRPWGQTWEDVGDKPYHYEDWYLSMIQEGRPMPNELPD